MERFLKMKILAVVSFSALVSGCAAFSPIPNCPTDDALEYFLCAKPTISGIDWENEQELEEEVANFVELASLTCKEPASVWVPALDKGIRDVYPDVKQYLKEGWGVRENATVLHGGGQQLASLNDRDLYHSVAGMLTIAVIYHGFSNYRVVYGSIVGIPPNDFIHGQCFFPNPLACQGMQEEISCIDHFEWLVDDGYLINSLKR